MIVRPFTFLTGLLFALSGAYLFVVKHNSRTLENRLEQLAESSRHDEQSIRVLKAQWALEADPSRIAQLASQFTGLQPMKPGQLVTLASLANSLPAPGSPAPFSNPEDMVPAMPGASGPAGPAIEVRGHLASAAQAGTNAAQPAAPEQVADNDAPAAVLPMPPISPPPPPVPHHEVERLASLNAAPRHLPVPPPPAPHQVQAASVIYVTPHVAQARAVASVPHRPTQPLGARVVRVRATATMPAPPRPAPPPQPDLPLGGGSLLGMAQTGSQN
ncbi:hypothetical protein SAMN02746095_01534 [Acidocella aminolytica 101 = DSM 11237]|uniref:cell division protein FtsL n=3 Tax=Acidocella aminolytica TaxID=33998 RepID=UPI00091668FA|nr:hypothetical protein [Acidocella aminolytica]SHE91188.1 hypothetical protein SAMN02746095_01534 [Acidocella aminolytica 101 = DSM 11237]